MRQAHCTMSSSGGWYARKNFDPIMTGCIPAGVQGIRAKRERINPLLELPEAVYKYLAGGSVLAFSAKCITVVVCAGPTEPLTLFPWSELVFV